MATISLNINIGSDTVDTQGIPFDDSSRPVVETLSVLIFDAGGETVNFDDDLMYDPDGETTYIDFGLGENIQLSLPAGSEYSFEVKGFDMNSVWMSYGEAGQTVDYDTGTIDLKLHTLIEAATFVPGTPINAVVPGQTLDMYVNVKSPGSYAVPTENYALSYMVNAGDGEISDESDLGARVAVTDTAIDSNFGISVTISGWHVVAGEAIEGDVMTVSYTAPFVTGAGFSVDTTASTLSVTNPSLVAGKASAIRGSARDDVGIFKLQVFEGPVLIGSSDATEHLNAGVSRVRFTGDDWLMYWTAAEGNYNLTVIAKDASGNEVREQLNVSTTLPVPPDYDIIVTNENDSGPGSLRQAINDANAGDIIGFDGVLTIYVHSENLYIQKDLTIIGDVTLHGGYSNRVLSIGRDVVVVLEDLLIWEGYAIFEDGGGIYNRGTLTLKGNTRVSNSTSDKNGGGVYNDGTLTLQDNASILHNVAYFNGAGVYNLGTLTLQDNASIKSNSVSHKGGGILNRGILNGADYDGLDGNDNIYNNSPDQVFFWPSKSGVYPEAN